QPSTYTQRLPATTDGSPACTTATVGPRMAARASELTMAAGTNSSAQVSSNGLACSRYSWKASIRMSATPFSGVGTTSGLAGSITGGLLPRCVQHDAGEHSSNALPGTC